MKTKVVQDDPSITHMTHVTHITHVTHLTHVNIQTFRHLNSCFLAGLGSHHISTRACDQSDDRAGSQLKSIKKSLILLLK